MRASRRRRSRTGRRSPTRRSAPARIRTRALVSVIEVVSLVGMPGSGKSTIGRELARRLDVPFADCDKVVEQRAGCSIALLFEREGEPAFRDIEAETLAALVEAGRSVIATGGGTILRADSRTLLRTRSTCVYLNAPVELLWKRLRRDRRRPLLQVENAEARLHQLAEEREPLYRETATIVVDVAGLSFDRIVDSVLARVKTSVQPS